MTKIKKYILESHFYNNFDLYFEIILLYYHIFTSKGTSLWEVELNIITSIIYFLFFFLKNKNNIIIYILKYDSSFFYYHYYYFFLLILTVLFHNVELNVIEKIEFIKYKNDWIQNI